MKVSITVPSVGESITRGTLSAWLAAEGAYVEEGGDLFELETDKATVTVPAPASGGVHITVAAGTDVDIGAAVGEIDTDVKKAAAAAPAPQPAPVPAAPKAAAPAPAAKPAPPAAVRPPIHPAASAAPSLSPSARRIAEESGLQPSAIPGTGRGGRVTKADAMAAASARAAAPLEPRAGKRRVPLSTIRKRIAEKRVEAQRTTAYLTTFNEVDMEKVSELRSRYREEFEKDHGVKLGFMSFFVKACCLALREMPDVNAMLEGEEIVYNDSAHIGVAVSTERGLIVPVVRNADRLSLAEVEAAIADLALRARDRKILPDELSGGTFTITNGGVFGSLMSTPLPNYPQTAILGMHAIQRRPVAVGAGAEEKIVIKPMMYVALTYDHRLIDGRDAVLFLRRVKELVEDPDRLLLEV